MPTKTKKSKSERTEPHENTEERCGPLFPPCPDDVEAVMEFLEKAETEKAYSDFLESQCGATDDSQPVEQYDGTLGVTIPFVNAHQSEVGQLQWNNNLATIYTNPGTVSGVRWCTGTLISKDLFLAAGHCFDQTGGGWIRPKDNTTGSTITPAEIATNMHVNFNYQVDPNGNMRVAESFPVVELKEYRLGNLDFAIVRLGGNPGDKYGTTKISTTDASVGDMVCIIGHPAGVPKRIEAGPVTDLHDNRIGYNDIDTLGGNSGSGILRASDGKIVGVHTNGGCSAQDPNTDPHHNHGVRISSILTHSPIVKKLTKLVFKPTWDDDKPWTTTKFIDDGQFTLKFLDDGGTIKKVVDDIKKHPAQDKPIWQDKAPSSDWHFPTRPGRPIRPRPGISGGIRPFALATPHHSMVWARGQAGVDAGEYQELLVAQYEAAITQLEQIIQQGSEELEQLSEQYQQLIDEYQALISGQV